MDNNSMKDEMMKIGGWPVKLATMVWSVLFGLFWWWVITTLAL